MDKSLIHQSLTLFYRVEGPGPEDSPPPQRGDPERIPDPESLPVRPTAVLVHGFAEDGSIWEAQIEYLRKNFRLIIPDLPGSGKSSPLSGETSMEEMADFVKAVLDAEKTGPITMIGHSMGGYITLAFAEKYPERLNAFGLFHSSAYADTEEKKAARRKGIEFVRKHGAAEFIRQTTPNLFSEMSRREHPELLQELIGRYANFNPDSLVYYYNAMIKRPDRTHVLKNSGKPVLFIIGEQDNAIPLEWSLEQTHLPGLSGIHILENTGHLGMLEDSDRCNRFLDEFLRNYR